MLYIGCKSRLSLDQSYIIFLMISNCIPLYPHSIPMTCCLLYPYHPMCTSYQVQMNFMNSVLKSPKCVGLYSFFFWRTHLLLRGAIPLPLIIYYFISYYIPTIYIYIHAYIYIHVTVFHIFGYHPNASIYLGFMQVYTIPHIFLGGNLTCQSNLLAGVPLALRPAIHGATDETISAWWGHDFVFLSSMVHEEMLNHQKKWWIYHDLSSKMDFLSMENRIYWRM